MDENCEICLRLTPILKSTRTTTKQQFKNLSLIAITILTKMNSVRTRERKQRVGCRTDGTAIEFTRCNSEEGKKSTRERPQNNNNNEFYLTATKVACYSLTKDTHWHTHTSFGCVARICVKRTKWHDTEMKNPYADREAVKKKAATKNSFLVDRTNVTIVRYTCSYTSQYNCGTFRMFLWRSNTCTWDFMSKMRIKVTEARKMKRALN